MIVKGFAMVYANIVKNDVAEKLQNSGFSVEVGTNLNGHQIFAQVGKRTLVFFCMEKRILSNGKHAHRHSQVSSRQVAEAYLEEHGTKGWIAMCGDLWTSFVYASQIN